MYALRRTSKVRAIVLFTLLAILLTGCVAPAIANVNTADSGFEVMTSTVYTHPARGDVELVPGGSAALVVEDDKVTAVFNTVDLTPGNAYTAWWVVVNHPQACSVRPCPGPEVMGTPDLVLSEVSYADGQIADELGRAEFRAVLHAGEQEHGWFGHGFDMDRAELFIVLHDHGPVIEGRAQEMLSTWRGGCAGSRLNPNFPQIAHADGEAGPNDCIHYQLAVFQVGDSGQVEVVNAFGASPSHLPEGIVLDPAGNMYVSLGPPFFVGGGYGAVWQISPDGAQTTLVEYPDGMAPAGLAVDASGALYFARPDPDQLDVGIYRLAAEGGAERLPGTENMLVPNGLAIDQAGTFYATDSILGAIWHIPRGGATAAESWLVHDWLAGCEEVAIGANGIAFWQGDLYVANTAKGLLVYIPILEDGAPGEPEIVAGNPDCAEHDELFGMDGIALDVRGNVYAALVLQHKLVRIDPSDGTAILLLSEEDGLWNPASLAFGTGMGDRESLYIANYAVLPPEPANSLGPAVLKFDVGVQGLPLP